MSALSQFRDHCQAMATSGPDTRLVLHTYGRAAERMKVGPIPDAERDLWARLAHEIDTYLHHDDPATDETTVPLTYPEDSP